MGCASSVDEDVYVDVDVDVDADADDAWLRHVPPVRKVERSGKGRS